MDNTNFFTMLGIVHTIPLIDSISIVCLLMVACCASSFSSLLADSDSNFLLVAKKKTKLHYLQTYNSIIIPPINSTTHTQLLLQQWSKDVLPPGHR